MRRQEPSPIYNKSNQNIFTDKQTIYRDPCGKYLKGDRESAAFVSPGYPDLDKYSPSTNAFNCDIWIEVPEGKVVELKFIDFDLPEQSQDYVTVRSYLTMLW